MSQLSDLLREPVDGIGSGRTVMLGLLEDQTDGEDRARSKWGTLKQRLRLKGVGCCGGPTWSLRRTTIAVEEDEEDEASLVVHSGRNRSVDLSGPDPGSGSGSDCLARGVTNLAEALAAERHAREESVTETPAKVPLMRLLAETDGCDSTWLGYDSLCCVCLRREKGAALIPCGHTFCRVCSREICVDRGTCPLCNRRIVDVLDLY